MNQSSGRTATTSAPSDLPPPPFVLMTVKQLAAEQQALSEGSIRWDLHNSRSNGLEKSGALIRRGTTGRKILIDRDRYLNWMAGRL
jgi:hypothetical protein